jgi:hypothetical protein
MLGVAPDLRDRMEGGPLPPSQNRRRPVRSALPPAPRAFLCETGSTATPTAIDTGWMGKTIKLEMVLTDAARREYAVETARPTR